MFYGGSGKYAASGEPTHLLWSIVMQAKNALRLIFTTLFIVVSSTAHAQTVVVDNSDTDSQQSDYFAVVSGSWATSMGNSGVSPFFGNDYLHDGNTGGGSEVEWNFGSADPAKLYAVSAQWAAHPNRADTVQYEISHAGGTSAVSVNQQQQGGEFIALGDFVGVTKVVLKNDGANGYVVADAVQLTEQGPPPPATGEATIPPFRATNSPFDTPQPSQWWEAFFDVTNITEQPVEVQFTFIDESGQVYLDPLSGSQSTGNIRAYFSLDNYIESPVVGGEQKSASVTIPARSSIRISIVPSTETRLFWGKINWEQSSNVSVALIANGAVDYNSKDLINDSWRTRYNQTLIINKGLPF